ncbi:acetyl esterase [Actinopolyspora xinjiangensis]|uniref:Acetyl esterase n=1 Tax=Actinopolyspora xinjiangensis TaxID=405564 RepID=A0A1H0PCR3_9ACTN|nr:alpha/beta hydrolase [Actinopolyspora xinjiangensis]SDP02907.1 acetyl esterase [Actinopolyspora xinjiangensis]
MALDEATSAMLAEMATQDAKPLPEMTPSEAREFVALQQPAAGAPVPEMHRVDPVEVPVDGGDSIRVRLLTPNDSPRGTLVYYHGGGWVLGDIDGFDQLGRTLAVRTGCAVALVDYRLAPEHRYPTAVEDAMAALRWADKQRAELGDADMPLLVAGDSAGGNLAAVVARRAARENGPELALQVLVYPVTDHDFDTASYLAAENQLILTREAMRWFWDHYLPDRERRDEPDASPLRAAELSGLPPAVVLTAEHDVLRDEGDAYAERLRQAGVPVHHHCFAGQTHGFLPQIDVLPGSAAGLDYIAGAVEQHLTSRREHT